MPSYGLRGCYTAAITPLDDRGEIDEEGFSDLVDFQLSNGVRGIVVAGTTGEGPTVSYEENEKMLSIALNRGEGKAAIIAATGGNDTHKAKTMTLKCWEVGAKSALLVDPYYNAPSSIEIRKEYYEPIAKAVPDMTIIPYVIPSRTGTQLAPEDLALLARSCPNVKGVKDATSSAANAAAIRSLCGPGFWILSGDDDKTLGLMTDHRVLADGVISVISNIAPHLVVEMTEAALSKDFQRALNAERALKPLFELVTVKTEEFVDGRVVSVKARNPVPVKTMARLLGVPSGPCRPPLGKLTKTGFLRVLQGLRQVWRDNPEVLQPIEKAFGVSIEDRLYSPKYQEGLSYDGY